MPTALFETQQVEGAVALLVGEGFEFGETADELRQLPVAEPLQAYTVTAALAVVATGEADKGKGLARAAHGAAEVVDRICEWVSEELRQPADPLEVACKQGCFFCCFLRVNVTVAEVAAIRQFVDRRFSGEERSVLETRVEEVVHKVAPMTPRLRHLQPVLCPLNVEGRCSVYDVRPLTCRSHHSFSVAECETSYVRWEDNLPVSRNLMRKVCCEAAVEGLIDALAFRGHDARVLELPEALQAAMASTQPELANFDAAYRLDILEFGESLD